MDAREERELRLKRLKRKRAICVSVLAVCLLCLGGGYAALRQYQAKEAARKAEEEAAKNATESYKVTTFTYYDVAEFEYTNAEASYHFVRNDGDSDVVWIRKGQEDFPINLEKVAEVICTPCNLSATAKVETEGAALEDYGLDEPEITVRVTLADGTVSSFRLGNAAPYDAGYYMLQEETGDIWIVESWVYKALSTSEMKLVQAETFPETSVENIMEVTVAVRGEDTISYLPQIEADDTVTFPAIFQSCEKFIATTVQEYDCQDFSEYGLENPYVTVTVYYMESTVDEDGAVSDAKLCTMTAEIGDLTVSDNYYVRINGSPYVYIMTAANARKYIPE